MSGLPQNGRPPALTSNHSLIENQAWTQSSDAVPV